MVVIGGGVAGLTAVTHLAERGLPTLLLEAHTAQFGGRLSDTQPATFVQNGQTWTFPGEHGIHGIWSPYVNLKAFLARHQLTPDFVHAEDETWIFGQGSRVRKARIGRIIRESWLPAPFHYLHLFLFPRFLAMINWVDILALFPVVGSLFAAMSIDPLAEQSALEGMSLADFMRGWSPTLKSLFAGLARNALAGHPEEVPAAGFIAFLRFYTLLSRKAWAFDYFPATGGECMVVPLVTTAVRLGAQLERGAMVERISQQGDEWQVHYQQDCRSHTMTASAIVLALSAPAAQTLLQASGLVAEAEQWHFPKGVPTAIIRIWYGRQPIGVSESGMFSGDFVMDNFFWLDRIQQTYWQWREATGGSAVEMHIYGPPELLALPDVQLLAKVVQDANRAFPELREHRLHLTLTRNAATHTLFSVGQTGRHLGIVTPWPGLWACGDWVYHPTPALYLERAVTTAVTAVNAILQANHLPPFPVLPHPEPEWLAGKIARGWWHVRQAFLRRKKRLAS